MHVVTDHEVEYTLTLTPKTASSPIPSAMGHAAAAAAPAAALVRGPCYEYTVRLPSSEPLLPSRAASSCAPTIYAAGGLSQHASPPHWSSGTPSLLSSAPSSPIQCVSPAVCAATASERGRPAGAAAYSPSRLHTPAVERHDAVMAAAELMRLSCAQ